MSRSETIVVVGHERVTQGTSAPRSRAHPARIGTQLDERGMAQFFTSEALAVQCRRYPLGGQVHGVTFRHGYSGRCGELGGVAKRD
jgi:hypothetical protein